MGTLSGRHTDNTFSSESETLGITCRSRHSGATESTVQNMSAAGRVFRFGDPCLATNPTTAATPDQLPSPQCWQAAGGAPTRMGSQVQPGAFGGIVCRTRGRGLLPFICLATAFRGQ